jgi:hypothetical protein
VAEQLLADAVSDPLMSLFGSLEYPKSDISDRTTTTSAPASALSRIMVERRFHRHQRLG